MTRPRYTAKIEYKGIVLDEEFDLLAAAADAEPAGWDVDGEGEVSILDCKVSMIQWLDIGQGLRGTPAERHKAFLHANPDGCKIDVEVDDQDIAAVTVCVYGKDRDGALRRALIGLQNMVSQRLTQYRNSYLRLVGAIWAEQNDALPEPEGQELLQTIRASDEPPKG